MTRILRKALNIAIFVAAAGVLLVLVVATDYIMCVTFYGVPAGPREKMECEQAIKRHDYEAALVAANAVVKSDKDPCAYYLRARVQAHRKNVKGAVEDLGVAMALPGGHGLGGISQAKLFLARGRCHEISGERDSAKADYENAYRLLLDSLRENPPRYNDEKPNLLDVLDAVYGERRVVDKNFGFPLMTYEQQSEAIQDRGSRREAVVRWLEQYFELAPEIRANAGNARAKVFDLSEP